MMSRTEGGEGWAHLMTRDGGGVRQNVVLHVGGVFFWTNYDIIDIL